MVGDGDADVDLPLGLHFLSGSILLQHHGEQVSGNRHIRVIGVKNVEITPNLGYFSLRVPF